MTTIIFVLELVALAVLIICGALLLLDAGSKKNSQNINQSRSRRSG